jgi:hypothetical protein
MEGMEIGREEEIREDGKGGVKGNFQGFGKKGEGGLSAPPNKNPAYGPVGVPQFLPNSAPTVVNPALRTGENLKNTT